MHPSPAATTRPVRCRSNGLRTRSEIASAVERHFAERGLQDTRLGDIATDVGIQRAYISYHFADKRELYAAVLESVFSGRVDALPSGGSPAEV